MRLALLIFLAIASSVFGQSYSTTFSGANENPISEGGKWLNGAANGIDWTDIIISSHIAYGPGGNTFSDSTAVLSGSWGTNQIVSGKIHLTDQGSSSPEIEIRLGSTITAHNINGYELNYSCMTNSGRYLGPVRWNGAHGDFTVLAGTNTFPALKEDDILTGVRFHNVINTYVNGVAYVVPVTDTTFQGGAPGIGTDQSDTKNGFKSFTAFTWNSGTTWYVRIDGNDSNAGLIDTPGGAFRTVQQAVNVAVSGDTIDVGPASYGEVVTTFVDGTIANPILIQANPTNGSLVVTIKEFRATRRNYTLSGIQVFGGGADANNASVRIEPPGAVNNGSGTVITNCVIGNHPILITQTASFTTNSIHITSAREGVNFNQAGFAAGSQVFLGGDSLNSYTNIGLAFTVLSNSASGDTMYLTPNLAVDSGTNYYAVVGPGTDNSFAKGVTMVQGSGAGASNCVVINCTLTNMIGRMVVANGPNCIVKGNTFVDNHGQYLLEYEGSNFLFQDNFCPRNRNVLFFTSSELQNTNLHPAGGRNFDFESSWAGSANNGGATNAIIRHNWLQDMDNQGGQFENFAGSYGVLMESNVFVGMKRHGSMSRNAITNRYNTYFRTAYDIEETLSYGYGGVGGDTQTNCVFQNLLFVGTGEHANPPNEHPYTVTAFANFTETNNWSLSAETMGWKATPAQTGMLTNSADPLFVNPSNPLGPDGLPFTADDGLRPQPNSIAAIYGLGALPAMPSTNPIAHFRVANVTTWQDKTGTNFDLTWAGQRPDQRTNVIRHWAIPEALGMVPCKVTFDASQSIDGITPTNLYCVRTFIWTFGDGTTCTNHLPVVSHMYTTVGTNVVTLTFTTEYGKTATYSNPYRTLPGTNALLKFVAKTGNDSTGDGSQGNPWLTIQHAASAATANWIISVGPGGYPEIVDCTQSAASNQPVLFVGHGSEVVGFNMRNSDYMTEGFFANGTNVGLFGAAFYIYATANRCVLYNDSTGDYTNKYGVYCNNSSTNFWTAASDTIVSNCNFFKIYGPSLNMHGSNWMLLGDIVRDTRSEGDAIRAWGVSNRVEYLYCTNLSGFGGGGHADFIQSFGDFGEGFWNSVIEGCLIDGNDSQPITFEHDSSGNSNFTATYTNIVFRNNAFLNQIFAGSIDVDGVKLYNNLFYKLGTFDGIHVFVFGGTRGSANGTEITNNAFVATGNNSTTGWYPIPGDGGINNWTLTADYNFVTRTNFTAYTGFPRVGQDAHSINGGDPKFFSAGNGDFRINTNSILVAAGKNVPGVSIDLLGVGRPNPPDIGPYQATAGAGGGGGGGGADPAITVQPQNQTVYAGRPATFTVTATGGSPPHYAWTLNGGSVGTDSASYTVTPVGTGLNGSSVQVTVSDLSGSLPSSIVTLTVNQATYYVSWTNGLTSNDGLTTGTPWPQYYAITNAGQSNILVFMTGTYSNIDLSDYTDQQGLILRSQIKWGASITSAPALHGIDTQTAAGISNLVVDGFNVVTSAIDGIKFNGIYCTASNNWIHGAGGQGISAHNYNGTVIDRNLIEYCGTDPAHDHGIYVNGTNGVVRNNVIRYNKHYGLQIYDSTGDSAGWQVYGNLIYSNAYGMTIYSYGGYTNIVTGNTILNLTNDCINLNGGVCWITNNILMCGASYFIIDTNLGSEVVKTDYNLVSKTIAPNGTHDVLSAAFGFAAPARGLFWLSSTSPARGIAKTTIFAPVDFFGVTQSSMLDVGHAQFTAPLANDARTLDPSPAAGADYWGLPTGAITTSTWGIGTGGTFRQ